MEEGEELSKISSQASNKQYSNETLEERKLRLRKWRLKDTLTQKV